MLQESGQHAADDMQARALREQQIEGHQLLEAVENALEQNGNLLNADEQQRIRTQMNGLRVALQQSNHQVLKHATEALNQATTEFAQRRMDQSVNSVLAGRTLDSIE
jgi:molecular chaperone HscA